MEDTLKKLQKSIGDVKPALTLYKFKNWGGTQEAEVILATPTKVEDVQKIVGAARKQNLRVRAYGGTHSWSPLFSDNNQVLIDYYTNVEKTMVVNEPTTPGGPKTITVSAGVTLGDLIPFFCEHNICFPSNPILTDVTMAGVVSTGCHGLGWDQPSVSDWITSVTLVDSSGKLRTFKEGNPKDNEVLSAIKVSLGMFGIITELTIKVSDMFQVIVDNRFEPLMNYFFNPSNLRDLVTKNWSVELYWFPFESLTLLHGGLASSIIQGKVTDYRWNPMVDKLWMRVINPVDLSKPNMPQLHLPPVEAAFHKGHELTDFVSDALLKVASKVQSSTEHDLGLLGRKLVQTFHKHLDPTILNSVFKLISDEYGQERGICQYAPYAIHYRSYKDLIAVYDMSFAFDCPDTEEGFYEISKAITYIVERVQFYAGEGEYPLTTTVEMRWIGYSDTLLCPAVLGNPKNGGSGHTFYLEILSFEDSPTALNFFQDVFEYWKGLTKIKPLPHWGKMWSFLKGGDEYVREQYADRIKKFNKIKGECGVDPNNMFTNEKLRYIFNLPEVPHEHSSGATCF